MKQITRLLFILILTLPACYFDFDDDDGRGNFLNCEEGFGSTVTEELNITDFTGIKLSIDAQVYITQGDQQEVLVKGQDNIINELETNVRNDIWEIEFDDCVENHDVLRIYITTPNLHYISNNSSGKIKSDNVLEMQDMDIKNNGSGDIQLSLEADLVNIRNTGSGKLELEGVTSSLDINIDGSGDVEAFDLLARDAQVDIDGSGDVQVYVFNFLEIRIEGSGDVYYKGDPDIKITTRGSGKVFNAD